jgi:ribonuclease HI
MDKSIIYTDGASRGNPGPSSLGVVFCDSRGVVLKQYSEKIENTTNNVAEYEAVIFALKKAKALYGKKKDYQVIIRSDSKLLVSQLNGQFKVKDENIQKLFVKVWNLMIDFKQVIFELIPREKNRLADKLANEALDRDSQKLL